jgi:hypothetical protein
MFKKLSLWIESYAFLNNLVQDTIINLPRTCGAMKNKIGKRKPGYACRSLDGTTKVPWIFKTRLYSTENVMIEDNLERVLRYAKV